MRIASVAVPFVLTFAVGVISLSACGISEDQELAIGAADAAKADSELPIIHDSVIDQYVSKLGRSMALQTKRADLDWHFTVVNSPEVNAFALPAGFIYVNRGAIEKADREDQLAGVMGHEIGHVVRRHAVDQLQKRERGEVGILMVCTLTHACATVGGRLAIGVGANAVSARYSQRDEAQADSEGVLNTVHAGIDPEGLPSFFQKLLDLQTQQPTAVDQFFSTHPTDQSRVAATRAEIAALGLRPDQPLRRDSPEFHEIQARIRALPPAPPPKQQ